MPAKRYDYIYDTSSDPNHEDSLYHSSANNRLMRIDRHAGISAQDALDHVDDYFYNLAGNVTRIVSHDVAAGMEKLGAGGMGKRPDSSELADSVPYADTDGRRGARAIELARDDGAGGGGAAAMSGGSNRYTGVLFIYAENRRTVTFAMGDHWYWDSTSDTPPTGYGADWGREYRYDGARQRYLDRELSAFQLNGDVVYATATTNTHYDGNSPYWSKKHDSSGDVETGFELGMARINDLGGTPSTDYYHTDMLGTTRFLTQYTGESTSVIEPAVYTAFGELVSGTSGRFGYVGAHGYQTSDEMPYQHVGNRYYDPTTGRFLQRDPMGTGGGTNAYACALGAPTIKIDPSGFTCNNPGGAAGNTPAGMREVIETVNDMGDFGGPGIKGYTKHAINNAISREGTGVATGAILEAASSGIWRAMGDGTFRYFGKFATLVMREDGTIITLWATCSEGWRNKGG